MKNFILSLFLFLGFQSAMAQSTSQAGGEKKTLNMTCIQNDNILRISLTSAAVQESEGGAVRQAVTAEIAIRNVTSRKIVATIQLSEGSFSAGAESRVKAWMKIPVLGLDLNECGISGQPPTHAGFSIGN